jgi:hypothetical protein
MLKNQISLNHLHSKNRNKSLGLALKKQFEKNGYVVKHNENFIKSVRVSVKTCQPQNTSELCFDYCPTSTIKFIPILQKNLLKYTKIKYEMLYLKQALAEALSMLTWKKLLHTLIVFDAIKCNQWIALDKKIEKPIDFKNDLSRSFCIVTSNDSLPEGTRFKIFKVKDTDSNNKYFYCSDAQHPLMMQPNLRKNWGKTKLEAAAWTLAFHITFDGGVDAWNLSQRVAKSYLRCSSYSESRLSDKYWNKVESELTLLSSKQI